MNKALATIVRVAFASLVIQAAAHAADSRARLSVSVKIIGKEQWQNPQGTNRATVRTNQTLAYSTVLDTDGEVVDFNSKDPNYAQQQMAKAAQTAQAVTRAQGQRPMSQAEFTQRVEQEQKACKGNSQCLYDLSMKVAQWSNQMLAGNASTPPPEAGSGSYLNYFGGSDCDTKIHVTVDDATEGQTADVQGPVPFNVKTTADYSGDANERLILCSQATVVLDPKQGMIYTDGLLVHSGKGTVTSTQRGKTTQSETDLALKGEALEWVSAQLRRASLSGTRKTTVKITSMGGSGVPFAAQGGGTADVELSWKFERL